MATARSAYPSDPGNHPTQKLNTSQAAARNTSDKCLANKPATPPVVEMRLMCRSFGADSSNSRQADGGQFSSPTRQSPRIPAKASNAKGASTPCRLNFNAPRRRQAARKGPSERKLAPLPWFQVGGSRAPKGAQGGEAHRGSGGCRPHAWERLRRGGDRLGGFCSAPSGGLLNGVRPRAEGHSPWGCRVGAP